MRIVIAPDSFKGSLTAREAAEAMAEGARRVYPEAEIVLVPMADGGEGTVRALLDATGGSERRTVVRDPLGRPVQAVFGLLGDGRTAVLEMASASGLPLLAATERNPLITSTYGTGQLILAALDAGARRVLLGIGGSATNDGGAGMAQALGYRLLDAEERDLPPGGAALAGLARIDAERVDPRLRETEFVAACDVANPLLGPEGASAVYGPQKGATPEMVALLDAALARFARVVEETLGLSVADLPGAGAAGGLGAGLVAFCRARLQRGVDMVGEAVGLRARLAGADLVLTGEGRLDGQTVRGKTPHGVAAAAKECGLPVLAVAGGLGPGYRAVFAAGIDAATSIVPGPMELAEAMAHAPSLVADAAERILLAFRAGRPSADPSHTRMNILRR